MKSIITPISRNIGILYRVKYFVPIRILLVLYNTLVLPYISYCNIVWATSRNITENIILLQKKAIRICAGAGFRDHTNPLFIKLKTLKVDDINFLQTSIFMYRHKSNLLPVSFSTMFQPNSAVHSYPTRQATKLHVSNPHTMLAHKSIRHRGPDVWNSLPNKLCNMLTEHLFKRTVKHMLLSNM